MSTETNEKLLKALNIDNFEDFALQVFEMLGALVLSNHWQRGIIDSIIREGYIPLNATHMANWKRVIGSLELYEGIIWEMAPARAMLVQMRNHRFNGTLEENFELLNTKDSHGRVPYGLSKEELDDIADIFRRIADARQTTGVPVYDESYGHASKLGITST